MDVATGCGFTAASILFVHFVMFFVLVPVLFCY